MKPLVILVLLAGCAQRPVAIPEYRLVATCPEGVSAPPLPHVVTVEQLRANRDALADDLRHDEHALAVCAHRLRRADEIIRALERR